MDSQEKGLVDELEKGLLPYERRELLEWGESGKLGGRRHAGLEQGQTYKVCNVFMLGWWQKLTFIYIDHVCDYTSTFMLALRVCICKTW
jgi:hypothetical protein